MTATSASPADLARDPAFVEAHARLVADSSLQFDRPAFVLPEMPSWIGSTGPFFEWLLTAMPYMFWGVVALLVGLVLWVVAAQSRGLALRWPWQKAPVADEDDNWAPDQTVARALLADAETLAADGRFAEAARLLLRRSVDDIASRRPEFVKPSVTARDIAAADAIPTVARTAFAAIARVVEVSAFGSAAVGADAWRQCRDAYREFALAGSWRG